MFQFTYKLLLISAIWALDIKAGPHEVISNSKAGIVYLQMQGSSIRGADVYIDGDFAGELPEKGFLAIHTNEGGHFLELRLTPGRFSGSSGRPLGDLSFFLESKKRAFFMVKPEFTSWKILDASANQFENLSRISTYKHRDINVNPEIKSKPTILFRSVVHRVARTKVIIQSKPSAKLKPGMAVTIRSRNGKLTGRGKIHTVSHTSLIIRQMSGKVKKGDLAYVYR